MAEHKIQSSGSADDPSASTPNGAVSPPTKKLVIDLDPIPKFLKTLVDGWAPECLDGQVKGRCETNERRTQNWGVKLTRDRLY